MKETCCDMSLENRRAFCQLFLFLFSRVLNGAVTSSSKHFSHKFPVDGLVIDGQCHVNESMITGEALPGLAVSKGPGDKVIGGTVNENGYIRVKATHVGSETTLSQIVELVEAAQLAKAPVQKLADQIAKFFVPIVVVAAFLTWLGWFVLGEAGLYPINWIPTSMDTFEFALEFGISVLVIACPCALGLATPIAVMVATGKGASLGVLIKGGNALQNAHKVKTVVFDKTGTLTIGKPAVVSFELFSAVPEEEFCDLTIAAEVNSEHPIAKAVYSSRLNYIWVLGYNVLGVPVAAGVLYPLTGIRLPPWLASACMAASSVSVVCSSPLLQYYNKPLLASVAS